MLEITASRIRYKRETRHRSTLGVRATRRGGRSACTYTHKHRVCDRANHTTQQPHSPHPLMASCNRVNTFIEIHWLSAYSRAERLTAVRDGAAAAAPAGRTPLQKKRKQEEEGSGRKEGGQQKKWMAVGKIVFVTHGRGKHG